MMVLNTRNDTGSSLHSDPEQPGYHAAAAIGYQQNGHAAQRHQDGRQQGRQATLHGEEKADQVIGNRQHKTRCDDPPAGSAQ